MESRYLDLLRERVLLFDGAMGTQLQARGLTAADFGGARWEGCLDYLSLTRPDVVEDVHAAYFAAGADVVETNSFQASRVRLDEWGLGDRTLELNRAAAAIARRVADRLERADGRPRFAAGSMGPSGLLPSSEDPELGRLGLEGLVEAFRPQAQGLVEGGADLLILETGQDLLEMKAQVLAAREAFAATGRRLPLQCSASLDPNGRMLLGTDIAAALATFEALGVEVVGLNCSTGPDLMRDAVRYLSQNASAFLHVIPNAGIPVNDGGRAVFPMGPGPMAAILLEFVAEFGVNAVGGCCGTTPEHIRALAGVIGRRAPAPRPRPVVWSLASGMTATALRQEPRPLLIGERLNTQGSRKVKALALEDRLADMIPIARRQVEGGAHALDVCMALTERTDEAAMLRRLVKKLSLSVEAPLCLDSTEPPALEEALKACPGVALVNSINLESGRERLDAVMPLVVRYGAAVIGLTIDEQGMAKTAARKLEVARRLHAIVTGEYGLPAGRLVIDPLTFTLATGDEEYRNAAVETLAGIRAIHAELPGVLTSLGVSNVSFGLSREARAIVNSVFLYHAVQAGLDMAIVNPADITPYADLDPADRERAEDLVLARDPQALAGLLAHLEGRAPAAAQAQKETDADEALPVEQRIHRRILHRRGEGIAALVDEAVARSDAVTVLNTVLLPAMKEVGDKFGTGELILPFVLQSAEVMKLAVAQLETHLERSADVSKGRIVLATVHGDVHDIGKNLVKTILVNNGYTVVDLGKQVPVHTILEKAQEIGADAIGLSALLVSTSRQMPACVAELDRAGLRFPVLIGGAAIHRDFGRRAAMVGEGRAYEPGVYYCKDAFEGLDTLNALMDPARRPGLVERARREALEFEAGAAARETRAQAAAAAVPTQRVVVSRDVAIPVPRRWGAQVTPTTTIPFAGMFAGMDLKTLYRLHWGARGSGAEYERLVREDFEPRRLALQREAQEQGWLEPRAVWGCFPCRGDGQDLVIYDSESFTPGSLEPRGAPAEWLRFTFPRQSSREGLCLSDYFLPPASGRFDVVAFQVVTVGGRMDERVERLNAQGRYADALFVHGLGVAAAEGLAEWHHAHVRAELALAAERGKRYSFGYSACPDLADQLKLFRLLEPERAIGVTLTDAFQIVPEASTSALIVHHPGAMYYLVKE
jgi:5-methyltetrahydrofolate--homocysteine methyltransferase